MHDLTCAYCKEKIDVKREIACSLGFIPSDRPFWMLQFHQGCFNAYLGSLDAFNKSVYENNSRD